MNALNILIFLLGFLLGALVCFVIMRRRQEELRLLQEHMKNSFAALSKETLVANVELMNSSFKQSIDQLFKTSEHERADQKEHLKAVLSPLKESLVSVDKKVAELEKAREGAYSGLQEQVSSLLKTQHLLHQETHKLSRALVSPSVRGRWGEMQLRRAVELSGLSAHCDFIEQVSITSGDEIIRPDMIIKLGEHKNIVVDAKAPLEIFASADTDHVDPQFTASLRRHVNMLKKKNYHKFLSNSPEFCVMFLPGEVFLHKALIADPLLIDFAAQQDIIIATPVTLIALLKSIAFGFKQEALASNIEEVRMLSQQLIDRVRTVSEHFEKLGRHLNQATLSYNQTLSSLDSRVLVTARKLAEIKSVGPEGPQQEAPLPYIESHARQEGLRE